MFELKRYSHESRPALYLNFVQLGAGAEGATRLASSPRSYLTNAELCLGLDGGCKTEGVSEEQNDELFILLQHGH